MIMKSLLVITFAFIALYCFSCTNSTEPSIGTNLLQNPSFELNGASSLNGWRVTDPDLVKYSNDVPPGGGKWSIYLDTYSFGPPISLYDKSQSVRPINGNHIYTFSFWGKYKTVPGQGLMYTFKGDTIASVKYVVMNDTSWTNYSIVDTISSNQADSILVKLYQSAGEVIIGRSYFDLCILSER